MRSTLTVKTQAATTALTTLARIRQDLSLTEAETDGFLEQVVKTCSAASSAYLNQRRDHDGRTTIGRETLIETWREDAWACWPRRRSLLLSRTPVADIVSVTEDGAVAPRQIDDPDNPGTLIDNPAFAYEIDRAAGLLRKLSNGYATRWTAAVVSVEYAAGWLLPGEEGRTLPEDIEDACVLMARRKIDQLREQDHPRLKAESLPGAGSWTYAIEVITWEGGLPSDVRRALDRYRRVSV